MSAWLIVGLGNPGPEYAHTRHNVGFDVVDRIRAQRKAQPVATEEVCDLWRVAYGDTEIHLLQPLTYMNASGQAVVPVATALNVEPQYTLVVYDCMDLELGRIRLRGKGSSGGHKGVQSVMDEWETDRFVRLRIGIGRPRGTTIEYVLSSWDDDEADRVDRVLDLAVDAALDVIFEGVETAMNRYNGINVSDESDQDAQQ